MKPFNVIRKQRFIRMIMTNGDTTIIIDTQKILITRYVIIIHERRYTIVHL